MKYYFLLLLVFQLRTYAQTASDRPDKLYLEFVQAYHELNVAKITKLYTQDAAIINLYDQQLPGSFNGQTAIKTFYEQYFKSVADNGQQMQLTFKITERRQSKNSIVDLGYFLLEVTATDKPATILYGRFYTQLVYQDQQWRFKTDAATNAGASEYQNATALISQISR